MFMHEWAFEGNFVKLFLYERQVDSSKTNASNIAINKKKTTNIPVAFLMAFKYSVLTLRTGTDRPEQTV